MNRKQKESNLIIPSDKALEELVVGSFLMDADLIHSFIQDFSVNLFFSVECRAVAECITDLYRKSEAIDIITVSQKARELKKDNIISSFVVFCP